MTQKQTFSLIRFIREPNNFESIFGSTKSRIDVSIVLYTLYICQNMSGIRNGIAKNCAFQITPVLPETLPGSFLIAKHFQIEETLSWLNFLN
jgi:hypothetical protein